MMRPDLDNNNSEQERTQRNSLSESFVERCKDWTRLDKIEEYKSRFNFTFNIQISSSLDLIASHRVLALVLEHRLLDGQLVDRLVLALILQQFYLVLLPMEDLITLEGPLGLLVRPAEGGREHDLLVLDLLDVLVLQWDNPFVRFLKIKIVQE